MAVRVGDVGVIIDFDTGENISDASLVELLLRHPTTGQQVVMDGLLNGVQIVRGTSVSTSFPSCGDWELQAHVVQPGKDRRSTIQTLTIQRALDG